MTLKEKKLQNALEWLLVGIYEDDVQTPYDLPVAVILQVEDVVQAIKEVVNG